MGGYGSGRRSWAKPTTDGALALDVRLLARNGRLAPGAHAFRWPSNWGDAGIALTVDADGDELTLDYRIRDSLWDDPRPVRQAVHLERTPCRFAGDRPWFQRPGGGAGSRCSTCGAARSGAAIATAWPTPRRGRGPTGG